MKLKLIHKLLIALFACTALVLALFTIVTRIGIGQDFREFLHRQELQQVGQVIPELESWYAANQGWQGFVEDPFVFRQLVLGVLSQADPSRLWGPEGRRPPPGGRRGPPGPGGRSGPRGGPPGGRDALPQRVFLLDGNQSLVVGELPGEPGPGDLMPVLVNGETVGWLGVNKMSGVALPAEEAFLDQLRNSLLIGLGLGLLVAALLAWLLARHLSRPVNEVAGGIRSLAAGNYGKNLDIAGSDEIARLADDVNRLSSTLAEHETARQRWMSDMAHELRTPLAIIKGELEAMADGVRPLDQSQLGSVQDEVEQLSALIDDLHHLALTDSGALTYRMQPVNLDEIVRLAVDSVLGQAAGKSLELSYEGAFDPVTITGDDQRLRQLLRNLLDNSVHYTDAGGAIRVTLDKTGNSARLAISDTAPGATAEQCERLFERLYRLETSRNRKSGGSGLGLAICRNIVKAHAGHIGAEPGPDGGILVTVTLPLAP
jgi:two-component system sensor histidine kinase BaeS